MFAALRWLIQRLQWRGERVPVWYRLLAPILLLPLLLSVLVLAWLHRRLIGPCYLETNTAAGGRMRCRLPDAVQTCVYLFGIWEPDITAFVARRLQPGDAFVDVGAQAGYYTQLAAYQVGALGLVVAVEASPRIFGDLQHNINLLPKPTCVRAVSMAAAAEPCTLTVFSGPEWNQGWTTTLAHRHLPHEMQVAAAPLDQILTEAEQARTRLIKIDVEGDERAVIAGMTRLLTGGRADLEIIIELSPAWWRDHPQTAEQALAPFSAAGFHAYHVPNSYLPWRYLWPARVAPPRRLREPIAAGVRQLDLVLSRLDQDCL